MINPLVMLVVVTTLYQKRGGHCFFIFKSGVILGNTRFLIKNLARNFFDNCAKKKA